MKSIFILMLAVTASACNRMPEIHTNGQHTAHLFRINSEGVAGANFWIPKVDTNYSGKGEISISEMGTTPLILFDTSLTSYADSLRNAQLDTIRTVLLIADTSSNIIVSQYIAWDSTVKINPKLGIRLKSNGYKILSDTTSYLTSKYLEVQVGFEVRRRIWNSYRNEEGKWLREHVKYLNSKKEEFPPYYLVKQF